MSVGHGFINQLLLEQVPPTRAADFNLDSTFFIDEERAAFNFITDFFSRYGSVPSKEVIEAECDITIPETPEGTLGYWADKIRERRIHHDIRRGVGQVTSLLADEDFDGAVAALQSIAIGVSAIDPRSALIDASDAVPMILQRHADMQNSASLLGVTFGFPFLDDMTGGAQAGDLIILTGRPGSGKSYLLIKMALEAVISGRTVLFVTNEMTAAQIVSRALSLLSGVTHNLLKRGRLSQFALHVLEDTARFLRDNQRFKLFEGMLVGSVQDIVLRIREVRPDVVYVDGAYLLSFKGLRGGSTWEQVKEVATELKKTAMGLRIPVFATYQQSRKAEGKKGASIATVAYSDAVPQLSSIALDLSEEELDEDFAFSLVTEKIMTIFKGREGEYGSFKVSFNMRRMKIEQGEILTSRQE